VVPFRRVRTAEDAVRAAVELGYPVAVKSVQDRWQHRSDLVGVRLDLATEDTVRHAYADVCGVLGVDEAYVQQMAERGTSCVIDLLDDPSFGTVVSFGLSGVASELLGDKAYRAVPLSEIDVSELVRAPRAAPLLMGYRGGGAADLS